MCVANNASELLCTAHLANIDGWLVVGFKADCLTRDLGLKVECPLWESF